MTQLGNVNQPVPVLLPLLASVCLIVGMVVGLLGIKIWWFKHRLTFDQKSSRNGVAGNSQVPFGSVQRGRIGSSSSRDKQCLQVDGAAQIHGVFRKRQEDEWDIERPAVLPPVRLSKSTPNLKLVTRSPKVENEPYTANNPPLSTGAPKVPVRKRKEIHSTAFEELTPPTREPPKPPQDTNGIDRIDEASKPTFDLFAQFERVNFKNNVEESEVSVPLLPALPPSETLPEFPLPAVEMELQNVTHQPSTSATVRFECIATITQNVQPESQPTKFIKAKAPAAETDLKNIAQRRVTGFLPPDLEELRAMTACEVDVDHEEQPNEREAETVLLRANQNRSNGMEGIEQRERNSYVEYEKVDEFDASLDFLLRKKWEAVETVEPGEHRDAANTDLPTIERIDINPHVTLDLFEKLEETNVDRTVEHLWLKIEQNNEQHLDTNFRMIRHSNELNEADILDVRQEPTELQENEIVTTPTGFGKSIDEDWDNFENLSLMASAEQIFEPRMEQINIPMEIYTDRSTAHVDTLFQSLEIPLCLEPDEEGATALFIQDDNVARGKSVTDTKLPDYESLMAHDTSQFLLPDYEAAVQIESRLNESKKAVTYVSRIEDLYDELHEDTVEGKLVKAHSNTAYITNIDELYEDLGLVHKPSVRFPTESYLDAKSEFTHKKVNRPTAFGGLNEGGTDVSVAPKPAQRRTKTRMKVRFDIESSQYYQPDELEPQSDSEKDDCRAPKPKLRTNRLYTDDNIEEAASCSSGLKKPMLFGSHLSTLNEEFQNGINQFESINESWQAISQHRAMAEEFEQCEELNAHSNQKLPQTAPRELPKPAFRNPLAQVLVDNRPKAAVRKTSSASNEPNGHRQFELLDNRQHDAEA